MKDEFSLKDYLEMQDKRNERINKEAMVFLGWLGVFLVVVGIGFFFYQSQYAGEITRVCYTISKGVM